MKNNLIVCSLMMIPAMSMAAEFSIASPDGKTVVEVNDNNGQPAYAISFDGKPFIVASPLGLRTNFGDYSKNLHLSSATEITDVSDSYSLPNIKKSRVDYRANRQEFTFSKDGKQIFDVIFEVSDNNVAFRYRLHPQGETLCCIVESETTGFTDRKSVV